MMIKVRGFLIEQTGHQLISPHKTLGFHEYGSGLPLLQYIQYITIPYASVVDPSCFSVHQISSLVRLLDLNKDLLLMRQLC